MEKSWPTVSSKSWPRRLSTTAPSTADAQIRLVVVAQREPHGGCLLGDAPDAAGRIAPEHGAVLGHGRGAGGLAHRIEHRILGAAHCRVELLARELEGNAQFDERLHAAHIRLRAVGRRLVQALDA